MSSLSIGQIESASPAAIAGVIPTVVCFLHQLYRHTKTATAAFSA
jgi:hypothetical protein